MIRELLVARGSTRGSAMIGRGLLTALIMLLAVPVIIQSSNRSLDSMFNAPLRWIPRETPSRQEFNRFLEQFGSHELVMVSWPGCDVDDERLDEIADVLIETRDERLEAGLPPRINHVLTGNDLLRQLTEPPIRLARESALRRLRGVVIGPDDKTSCVLVEITDLGAVERRESVEVISNAITHVTGLDADDLVLAGAPVDAIAIDDESVRSINAYSIPSAAISLLLCWFCLRSLWLSVPVMIVGVFGQGLMLAMVDWSGSTMNAILIVLPALVFVLSVSAGVHLINYFIEELGNESTEDAPARAMANARGPCLLAALTTAIGLASLSISTVQPVHDFGVLGAIGLMICMGLLFLLVPAFMTMWLRLPWIKRHRYLSADQAAHPMLARLSDWVLRHSAAIRITCLASMVIIGTGLIWLRTSVDVMSLLSSDNRAVQDFRWVESHIGPLVPVEVVVHFDDDSPLELYDRLGVVNVVQNEISEIEILDGTVSAATFLPAYTRSRSVRGTAVRSIVRKRLVTNRDEFVEAKYLADTPEGEAWRISARIYAEDDFDHEQFLVLLQTTVDDVLSKFEADGDLGISATCTGVTAVVHGVQESLLSDLFNSFLVALLLVAVVMMFALRSVLCGLLAMIPNVFPMLVLFGRMGWTDRPVDIGSVMTASVALGIAVDGTFHFLKWFTHSVRQGKSQSEAIAISFQHCGRALVQTTVICASGLVVFCFSGFLPVRHFSMMMMMMMVAALVGDLILLPALLAGRLGSALCRACQGETPTEIVEDATVESIPRRKAV